MTLTIGTAALEAAAGGGALPPHYPNAPSLALARAQSGALALRLESVTLTFGGVAALRDVSLAFAPEKITSVIGPNGAGKTSLMNVICGVYAPDHGSIVINERTYARVPTTRLASLGIARTFQNLGMFKGLSALDNVKAGLSFAARATLIEEVLGLGRAPAEARETQRRAEAALELLGLEPYRDRLVGGLPYGVQKRVELARAVVAEPRFLLLDEPLAGMTVDDKAEMFEFIRAIQRRLGTTIGLIEHDIGVVMDLSDHVAVLDYGRKIAEGTPAEVQADQAVIDAYLGAPHEQAEA